MEGLSQAITAHVPWLWPIVAWGLALLLVLAVFTLPAYFVVHPVTRSLRLALHTYLIGLIGRHKAAREDRRVQLDALADEFKRTSGIAALSPPSSRLEAALVGFTSSAEGARNALTTVATVSKTIKKALEDLARLSASLPTQVPAPPGAQELVQQGAGIRLARVQLVITTFLLLAIMTVNTGMLGEILKDLGVVPHDLVYFGIPLYLVFAFILTLVEAGLGYAHKAGVPSSEHEGKITAVQVFTVIFACVIACVEGFFYSQVAPSKNELANVPIGIPITQATLFFGWGAALVMALFTLGSIWAGAIHKLAESGNFYPRMVRRIANDAERLSGAVERHARHSQTVRVELETVDKTVATTLSGVEKLRSEFDSVHQRAHAGTFDSMTPHNLSGVEARHFIHQSGMWLLICVAASIVLVRAAHYAAASFFQSTSAPSGAIWTAIGIMATAVTVGMLFTRGDLIVDGIGSRRLIVSGSAWRGRSAVAISTIAIVAMAVLLTQLRMARYQLLMWVLTLILSAAVAASASQTMAMSKGLRVWFRMLGSALARLPEAFARLLVRSATATATLIEILALMFAAPIFLLKDGSLPSLQFAESHPALAMRVHSA